MAELYVQYQRTPYFDRQSGMTLEVRDLTEPVHILPSNSRPSARLLTPSLPASLSRCPAPPAHLRTCAAGVPHSY